MLAPTFGSWIAIIAFFLLAIVPFGILAQVATMSSMATSAEIIEIETLATSTPAPALAALAFATQGPSTWSPHAILAATLPPPTPSTATVADEASGKESTAAPLGFVDAAATWIVAARAFPGYMPHPTAIKENARRPPPWPPPPASTVWLNEHELTPHALTTVASRLAAAESPLTVIPAWAPAARAAPNRDAALTTANQATVLATTADVDISEAASNGANAAIWVGNPAKQASSAPAPTADSIITTADNGDTVTPAILVLSASLADIFAGWDSTPALSISLEDLVAAAAPLTDSNISAPLAISAALATTTAPTAGTMAESASSISASIILADSAVLAISDTLAATKADTFAGHHRRDRQLRVFSAAGQLPASRGAGAALARGHPCVGARHYPIHPSNCT
ncbi:hypothetical protein BC828DRAFT_401242 [Blastocladiella britannica]|nr:hypothetical protein BC828DRAFT_401242 [Blastocladiella britannica]